MRICQRLVKQSKLLLLIAGLACNQQIGYALPCVYDDWIASETCTRDVNKLCHGYYKEYSFGSLSHADSNTPLEVTSDNARLVAKGTSVFSGNVNAIHGNKVLNADTAEVAHDQDGNLHTITALGNVKLMYPGVRVDGDKAVVSIPEDRKTLNNACYRLYPRHARGECKQITVYGDNLMHLDNATYTTCAPASNAWHLKASETTLNDATGQGEAWHAKMYLRGIPIFYWPYVNFPIDKRRQSGFLQPEYEGSSLNGKTAILPYYLNLAPNYDATITTNYMSLRSWKFDTIFRYLTHTSNGIINFDFLPHDRAYRALRNDLAANQAFQQSTVNSVVLSRNALRNSDFRYRFAVKHHSEFSRHWLFNVNYTTTSDSNYLYDFSNYSSSYATDQFSTLYALQRASLSYLDRFGTINYTLERHKTYHPVNIPAGAEQLSKLPQITYISPLWNVYSNLRFTVNSTYTQFRPQLVPDNTEQLSYGHRFHMRPALSYPMGDMGWFIIPRAQFNYVYYSHLFITPEDLASGVDPNNPHLLLPIYDVHTGLNFERNINVKGQVITQTLEPRLYYLNVPSKNQNDLPNFDSAPMTFDYNQLFRDNRYSGADLISETNQISMGLASKFFQTYSGTELGMLAIGRIYYFRDDVIRLVNEIDSSQKRWSPYVMVAKLNFNQKLSLEANWIRAAKQTNTASVNLQYKRRPVQVLNLSYQYVLDPEPDNLTGTGNSNLHQIGASAAWQVASSWRLLGKLNYDLLYHRQLETIAGFEYHTCCTALRFVWSRTWMADTYNQREYNHRFRLQFIFKGFAGVGNAEDKYIASVIPGYAARAH